MFVNELDPSRRSRAREELLANAACLSCPFVVISLGRLVHDVLAVDLLVASEHERVRGVDEAGGGAPPDDEDHVALVGHFLHGSGEVAEVVQGQEQPTEKSASTLRMNAFVSIIIQRAAVDIITSEARWLGY